MRLPLPCGRTRNLRPSHSTISSASLAAARSFWRAATPAIAGPGGFLARFGVAVLHRRLGELAVVGQIDRFAALGGGNEPVSHRISTGAPGRLVGLGAGLDVGEEPLRLSV